MSHVFSFVVGFLVLQTQAYNQWADPPTSESANMASLIDEAVRKLESGISASTILSDPKFSAVHPFPRFRETLKRNAPVRELAIVGPHEPGEPLEVVFRVLKPDGKPASGVLLYLYQTSDKGYYAQDAAHFRANSGDFRHARLFGYVRSDETGTIVIRTIRPRGYPGSELPAHVHLDFSRDGRSVGGSELQFSDDPRLTPEMRDRSRREGAVVATPHRHGSTWKVEVEYRLSRA